MAYLSPQAMVHKAMKAGKGNIADVGAFIETTYKVKLLPQVIGRCMARLGIPGKFANRGKTTGKRKQRRARAAIANPATTVVKSDPRVARIKGVDITAVDIKVVCRDVAALVKKHGFQPVSAAMTMAEWFN